ncbi:hypothetical protein MTO96_050406, partial [Rhipicephalus appendiculatus]
AEGYGLTETGGAATIMEVDEEGNYSVWDKPNPRGEIPVGGPGLPKGYFKRTKEEDDPRVVPARESGISWFYAVDVSEIFPGGTLKIIDRKKDLIKLQYCEYVSLGAALRRSLKTCPHVARSRAAVF